MLTLQLGDARRAIGYLEQALAIRRKIGDRMDEGTDLGNLGNAYLQLGDAQRAIGYLEQALVIRREIGDRPRRRQGPGQPGDRLPATGQRAAGNRVLTNSPWPSAARSATAAARVSI